MFESREHAAHVAHSVLGASYADAALEVLIPAIGLRPDQAHGRSHRYKPQPGETRLGGTPDLPAGVEWPRPNYTTDDLAEVIEMSGESDGQVVDHMRANLPLAFLGQIDLLEIHAVSPIAADLPAEGRLFFFFDLLAGPYSTSDKVCRVLWDNSPDTSLVQTPLTADALEAHERELRWLKSEGILSESDAPASVYYAPPQTMTAFDSLTIPVYGTGSPEHDKLFRAIEAGKHVLSPVIEEFEEFCTYDDVFVSPEWRRHQILGLPVSVQADPRQYLDGEKVEDWRQLFQISLRDWDQGLSEGDVHFLIRKRDLKRGYFEGVRCVYLQT